MPAPVNRLRDELVRAGTHLDPPSLEAEFRESLLGRERTIATLVAGAVILFSTTSLFTDHDLLAGTGALPFVWGIRGVAIAAGVGVLLFLRRNPGVHAFDRTLLVWSLSVLAGIAAANALFPPSYVEHVAWDLLLVLGIYTVFPLPFDRQVTAALLFSLAGVLVLFQVKIFLHPAALPDILIAYMCANGVGIVASLELHRSRRQSFLSLQGERRAREKLEAARAEIRTLQGIIPICAVCKHVKTDVGEWEMVEQYVRDRSDADFSHGVCPDCARTLYPELTGEEEGS